jgi:aspartyl-tRNA(Asn)/glutamyl-tRNA(Gln) amidotransferase subunit A
MMYRTLKDIAAAFASGTTSRMLVEAAFATIEQRDGELAALLSLRKEQALAEADAADARRAAQSSYGPLDGVPIVLKDNMLIAGEVTTAASKILEHYTATETSTVVQKLQAAGAIILGKANLDEFAMGASTENSAFGPSKNPWDITKVPGGSSGGSAVAVAAGYTPLALGSDTGGSIRQPAGFCNLVGFKPTYGRVSRSGLIALASSLDQIGTFAHTVEDAAIAYEAIAGHDPLDATTSQRPVEGYTAGNVKGIRIGVPKEFFAEGLEPAVRDVVEAAIATYQDAGAEIVPVSLPHAGLALAAYYVILPAEASSNLARFDGIRYGMSDRTGASLISTYRKTRGQGFGREVKRRIMLGTFALSSGYADAYYHQARRLRDVLREEFHRVFDTVDVILTPTSPTVPFAFGARAQDPLAMYLADLYTVPANLAEIPALSLPAGFADGLPVGMQLMAKKWNEAMLFRVGGAYQSMTDWHTRDPK